MNTTTRFTIVDDLSWLTERIILAGEQLLNPQGSALLDIREFSWFNSMRRGFSFLHGSKYLRKSKIIYCQIIRRTKPYESSVYQYRFIEFQREQHDDEKNLP